MSGHLFFSHPVHNLTTTLRLLALLVVSMICRATTAAVSFDSSKTYSIKNVGKNMFLGFQTASYTENNVINATPFSATPVEFIIKKSGSAYVIRFAGNGSYLCIGSKGWNTGISAEPTAIWTFEEADSDGSYYIHSASGYMKFDGKNDYAYTDSQTQDANSTWVITEVGTAPVFPEIPLPTITPDATPFTTIISGEDYCLRNVGCGKYLTLQTSYNEGAVVNATPLSPTPTAFTITQSGAAYNMKSGGAYIGISSSIFWNTKNYATAQNVWTFEAAEEAGQFYIKNSNGYLKYDGSHDYAYTNGSKTTDACLWALTPGPKAVATLTEGKYYRLRNYMDESRFITSNAGAIYAYPYSDDKYDQIWRATKSGDNWLLMCILDGQYIRNTHKAQAYATGMSGSPLVVTPTGTATDGRPYFMIAPASATTGYFNNSKANQNFQVVSWSDVSDNSSWWFIEQVSLTDDDVAAINRMRDATTHATSILDNADAYAATLPTYFADNACTLLKSSYAAMTDDALNAAIGSSLPGELKAMVLSVKNDRWDDDATRSNYIKRFRIADYEIYSDPAEWRTITNVGPFGVLTNPTGVTVRKNQLLYVMVGEAPADASATLRLAIAAGTDHTPSQTFDLTPGLNIFKANCSGECFVLYTLTNTLRLLADYAPITVHIEGGEATGCWDMNRGMTNDDWTWLCDNLFTTNFLHIKGRSTVLNVLTDNVRGAANPEGIMKIWDFIFDTEERLVGNDGQWNGRYRPIINPRHSYNGNPNWGGNYGTNHPSITKNYLFNFDKMVNDVGHLWEIYHEEAHAHQYPINIAATTESSNNGYAQMVNYEFGSYNSRNKGVETLITFKNNGWGWVDILRGGEGTSRDNNFQYYGDALWLQCHLFYQLYLYFHVQGHMPDFWPRVADKMRANPLVKHGNDPNNPTLYYEDYLRFAEACTDVSQTDLYEFFDTWGFFGYYDEVKVGNEYAGFSSKDNDAAGIRYVGDYGRYYLKMPVRGNPDDEARLAALKAKMQAMPRKAPGLIFIDDHISQQYVSDTCFIARTDIAPNRIGTMMGWYGVTEGTSGDYGMFTDFDGSNHTDGIDFSLNGSAVTLEGTGLLGVKVYGPDGRLVFIANTQSFTPSAAVRQGILDGTCRLVVVCGDDTEMPIIHGQFSDLDGDGEVTIRDVALLISYLPHSKAYNISQVTQLRDCVLDK